MPEVKDNNSKAKAWAPPIFPVGGRLPTDIRKVTDNYNKQTTEENRFRQTTNDRGQKRHSACCHSLHVSLFFDGTNNNEDNDTKKGHPSNIAKLFHASLRGTPAKECGYFSYYMPGVGTPFPEIGELDYSEDGLKYATGGEDRINWALVQVASALSFALTRNGVDDVVAKTKVESMSTSKGPMMSIFGAGRRRQVMKGLLEPLRPYVPKTRPEVLGIKLFVYGFSRGAAEARTFVTWLSQLFDTPDGAENPEQTLLGLPVSIEFLGVLDTVASVGIAHVTPFFAGHMDWADDSQLLPDAKTYPDFVKCCRHFVAAFEQRACFPLDSVRNEDGNYPRNTYEVVYPGVHSDVGGGYPKNDQGKARGGTDELVSQIVLHDMYAAAFAAGAPLRVPEAALSNHLIVEKSWRALGLDVTEEFDVSPKVIERFNAWHHQTLQTVPPEDQDSIATDGYHPLLLTTTVEDTLADQLGWITGWRIGRYANDLEKVDDRHRYNDSYKHQPFFKEAIEVTAYNTDEQRSAYEEAKRIALKNRQKEPAAAMNHPGPPIYEPQIDQTQLSQAATEFKHDYLDIDRKQTSWSGKFLDVVVRDSVYLLNENDEVRDHASIKAAGEQRNKQLFRDKFGRPSGDPGLALLVALFDEHIHDSRAWFMHDKLASRELWAGYFFYRMTYFGNENSRDLSPVVVAGRMLGVAVLAGATVYGIKRGGALGALGGLTAGMGAATIGYRVVDKATGAVVPFLPGAEEILQPTRHIGQVVTEQKKQIALDDYLQRMERTDEMLRQAGSLVEPDGEVIS
ncbi:T6SS phospholipase effector Tle1-like catalytic domain-containing protein [Pseudomonas sp. RL_105y_Pfl2_101]|uniref:T6SS phospholipase effector Tle1-like catalytic domain-containing protein n=1 Tax=Pseudomonas sp. RL_105y_Pfl2_101 TaxID=3088708 RepID=UPI0030DB4F4D